MQLLFSTALLFASYLICMTKLMEGCLKEAWDSQDPLSASSKTSLSICRWNSYHSVVKVIFDSFFSFNILLKFKEGKMFTLRIKILKMKKVKWEGFST